MVHHIDIPDRYDNFNEAGNWAQDSIPYVLKEFFGGVPSYPLTPFNIIRLSLYQGRGMVMVTSLKTSIASIMIIESKRVVCATLFSSKMPVVLTRRCLSDFLDRVVERIRRHQTCLSSLGWGFKTTDGSGEITTFTRSFGTISQQAA